VLIAQDEPRPPGRLAQIRRLSSPYGR